MSTRYKIVVPVLFLVIAVIAAVALVQARPVATREERVVPAPMVRVITVAQSDVRVDVTSQGTVRPRLETTLAAEVAGRIQSVSPRFAAGNGFRRGDVIARIDPRDYQVALAQAQAALAQARVRVAREEAEAQIARDEWSQLGKGEPNALTVREPQLADARASVAAAEAAIAQARLHLERTAIRAPFDGVLLAKHADLGQYVGPGAPVTKIAASDYAEIELPVTGVDLARMDLQSQPEVTIHSDAGRSGASWTGRIIRTGAQIDPQTRMLPLVAAVESPFTGATPLRIGQFVHASISGRTLPDAVEIPRAALRQGDRVLVVDQGERLRWRGVLVARLTASSAVITSGLTAGDRVVVSNVEAPVDGMPVRVADTMSDATATVVEETR